jgi:hypothetical protein
VLVAVGDPARVEALLAVAEPLVRDPPRVLVVARLVADGGELRSASGWLEERRSTLQGRGVTARAAAFTSTTPGLDLARLATELDVELVLADAPDDLLADDGPSAQLVELLERTPSDVALLVAREGRTPGPCSCPSAVPSTTGRPSSSGPGSRAPPACRYGSRRRRGARTGPARRQPAPVTRCARGATRPRHPAEPLLTPPGEEGLLEASRDAGLLVVGLSDRWQREASARPACGWPGGDPADGPRPPRSAAGRSAPRSTLTRFTWSIRR